MIPPALASRAVPAPHDTTMQLLLYGAVPDAMLDKLLERLAAIFPDSRRPYTPNDEDSGAGVGEDDDHLDAIRRDTAMMVAEYVFVPAVETPLGPARSNDVVLRLTAPLPSLHLDDKETVWSIAHTGRPEAPSPAWRTTRRAVHAVVLDGTADQPRPSFEQSVQFLRALGYRPYFQFVKKGFAFHAPGIATVLVYQTYNLPDPDPALRRINLHGVPPVEANHDVWVVEVASVPPPIPTTTPEMLDALEREMVAIAVALRGLVDVRIMDPVLLRDQVPYAVR
ncbi:hypothetical protein GGF32_009859 [Allomyces javanicus]|nr:hypothetical protein GGF32_009859 [Allomyces javanicus]